MSDTEIGTGQNEPHVIAVLLQQKIVTEAQLKAALDYQKSVGGEILDILANLGLVRSAKLEVLLEGLGDGAEPESDEDTRESNQVLDPADVDKTNLKLHHRLLDKLPLELVEKHLVLLFFPVNEACSRKLVVGHGGPITEAILEKIKERLGVEICSLALEESEAQTFVSEYLERRSPRKAPRKEASPAAPPAEAPQSPPVAESTPPPSAEYDGVESLPEHDVLLEALTRLLVKKGVIRREELQVEIELLRQLTK